MSQTRSPSAGKPYGLQRVLRVWNLSKSAFYKRRHNAALEARGELVRRKRGPKTEHSDEDLVEAIREVLASSPWKGEGYRKAHARLRARGIRVAARRVLRLMRENELLAPTRAGHAHGPKAHDGVIVTERPDEMWGTDATSTMTSEGKATIFFAIDHCTAECMGIHAALRGDRFEALEVIKQGVKRSFGRTGKGAAVGLTLRHDNGSQFTSKDYQREVKWLGIQPSSTFVREPQGNGCAERFVRTLKEQLLWLKHFERTEDLRLALHEFAARYNDEWLIQRHGHRAPSAKRGDFETRSAEAA